MKRFNISSFLLCLVLLAIVAIPNKVKAQKDGSDKPEFIKKYEVMPWELLKDEKFKEAYLKATEDFSNVAWLRELKVAAPPNKVINVDGKLYVYMEFCKIHNCGDDMVYLLYDPEQNRVFGTYIKKIDGKKREILIGEPSEEELNLLYRVIDRMELK